MLFGFGTLVVLIVAAGFVLGIRSHTTTPATGLQDGHLRSCPDSPNCVCSEAYVGRQPQHAIAPLALDGAPMARGWEVLQKVIISRGGRIESVDAGYLHATFTSRLFRFVDDVEARPDGGVIQICSASRVGRSDLGVNRQRVEAIRQDFAASLKAAH